MVDSADNCPLAYNPDQSDFDEDGDGTVCDAQEQAVFNEGRRIVMQFPHGDPEVKVPIPKPDCETCGVGYLPADYLMQVTLELGPASTRG